MHSLRLVLPVLFGVACGSTQPPTSTTPSARAAGPTADLRMICEEATAAATRDEFATNVARKLTSPEGRDIFDAAGGASDNQKNAVLKRGAAEVGVADWDCSAPLTKLYGEQTAEATP